VRIVAPFDSQSLVYRYGEVSFEQDPYAEFLASPGQIFSASIQEHLRGTGLFGNVVELGAKQTLDEALGIQIIALYGDFRDLNRPTAVLRMRFTLAAIEDGRISRVDLQREYREEQLLTSRTPERLVAGWDAALAKIIEEFSQAVAAKRATQ
jgi:hypothetical protein